MKSEKKECCLIHFAAMLCFLFVLIPHLAYGEFSCNGICTNLQSDNTNCGACGRACAAGTICSKGVCALTCQTGLTNCNGMCTNLQSDEANCGACGVACPAGNACNSGRCTVLDKEKKIFTR